MAECVVAAQSQSAPLLGIDGLQTGIAAVGIRAELVHIAETLVERLLIRKGREASIADCLIAVELHLERLMQSAGSNEIGAQIAACPDLLFDAKVVLIVVR